MKKRFVALLLAFSCVCGSALTALAVETAEAADPNTVYAYSEAEDPLTSRKNGDLIEHTAPEFNANNSDGKVSQYSFLTDKTYQVPSGYNVFHGIDVSKWEETINWSQVKNAGVDYAIIRVGYRGTNSGLLYEDPKFRTFLEGATSVGMPVGVYIYSQALTTEEAIAEANYALTCIEGYNISLPIVMDYEFYGNSGRLYNANLSKSEITSNALAFCETISQAGYQPMIYANKSFLTDNMYADTVSAVAPIWLAHYTNSTTYTGEYDYWQYAEDGQVDGISTDVDCNFFLTTGSLVTPNDTVKGFTDVLSSSWYAEAVSFAIEHNLMNGTSSTSFDPNVSLTRTMAARILYNMSGNPPVSYSQDFTDVQAGKWYSDAVIWAKQNGIMAGYPDGRFGVNDVITREQIATILYNYSKKYGVRTDSLQSLDSFTDASSVSAFAVTPIQWAVANGIIHGRTTTTLVPKGNASRAECAVMLEKYLTGIGASLLS